MSFIQKFEYEYNLFRSFDNKEISINGLAPSLQSLWITCLINKNHKPGLVVVADYASMEQAVREINFFSPKLRVIAFPDLDVLAYEEVVPNPKIMATRLVSLNQMMIGDYDLVIAPLPALLNKLVPLESLPNLLWQVEPKQEMNRDNWRKKLIMLGYSASSQVEVAGEFSFKGDRLDLFSAHYQHPLRIIFFDDEIESINHFDVDTQKSLTKTKNTLPSALIVATSEVYLSKENIERATANLEDYPHQTGDYQQKLTKIKSGAFFSELKNLLPFYYKELSSLIDYLSLSTHVFLLEPDKIKKAYDFIESEIAREHIISKEQDKLTLEISELINSWAQTTKHWQKMNLISLSSIEGHDEETNFNHHTKDNELLNPLLNRDKSTHHSQLEQLFTQLKEWKNKSVLITFVVNFETNAERIKHYLAEQDIESLIIKKASPKIKKQIFLKHCEQASVLLVIGNLQRGHRIYDQQGNLQQICLTDFELFAKHTKSVTSRKRGFKQLTNLDSLQVGDYITHLDYGIGCYEGLIHFPHQDNITDCLIISYLGNDKLYVPIDHIRLVQKYSSADNLKPRLSKLGEARWKTQKAKVAKAVEIIAKELIELYAKRKAYQGISFRGNEDELAVFASKFTYQETEDQLNAINDTLADLTLDRPMDRLICGDVGFGKTEVALRAAFQVVASGYQVAMVVPTTILAEQHFKNFQARFNDFEFKVGQISRFQTNSEAKRVSEGLASGEIDIIIGTHRLFSQDINFSKLGLLIIDEEHKFGVKQKEKIRFKNSHIDTLSLSATPIPRSLHMSLSGIRDISLINTPPMNRQIVSTRVLTFEKTLIKEAINRELRRGGQVYFIHNRVQTIFELAAFLQKLLPQVVVRVAHGKLGKNALENVMTDFIAGKFPVLLSSAIVESGLDIPNANSLIVNNADRLGLAQLYQLRGRVGRSATKAYAYFLVNPAKTLTNEAEKRLKVLQEYTALGSGFKIAAHDLEIRGAGNFLGSEQSGDIMSVGVETYVSMLDHAITSLKRAEQGAAMSVEISEIKMNIGYNAYLSDDYINSSKQRLAVYHEIADCASEEDVWDLSLSLEDRFGPLPQEAKILLFCINLKVWASKIYANRLDVYPYSLALHLTDKFKPDMTKLLDLLNRHEGQLVPPHQIRFQFTKQRLKLKLEILKKIHSLIG
ncbi:MAG: transcription-repair coupling factor [SAR324 cluster bacterium]|nr:transcription-repair coupling factor [SAR324 cluster bacterium]